MEVIRLSGYISEEKQEIARRYLIPKSLKTHGLKDGQVVIQKDALNLLIENYAREAGVRNLENLIKKISRKAVMAIVRGSEKKIVIHKNDVEAYLGKPVFAADEMFENVPGVVTGLAWTSMGGATLQIEAAAVLTKNKGFRQTELRPVYVESAEIAYSYVMAHLEHYGAKPDFFGDGLVAVLKNSPSPGRRRRSCR